MKDRLGDLADLDGVRSFRTLRDLKGHLVAFTKLIELYVHELVRVEKEILFLPVDFNEPETPVGESGDCSFLHVDVREIVKSTGCAEGGESTPTYLGQRRLMCKRYHVSNMLSIGELLRDGNGFSCCTLDRMAKESFINKRTLAESSDDVFVERVRRSATELTEFFETKGAGVPVRQVLERGFMVGPRNTLVSSRYMYPHDNVPGKIELSKIGQMPGIIGEHTRMHEMGHTFSRDQPLTKVVETLFPDGTTEKRQRHIGTKSGFHYQIQRPGKEGTLYLFTSLDEAMTDTIPIEILKTRNWGTIYQHFLFKYPRERNMLATAISSLAKNSGESEGDIFRLFVESYLTGWKPELKTKLLDTFGPNALRVLAIVNSPYYVKDQKDAVMLYRKEWWQFWTKHFYNEALTYFDINRPISDRDAAAQKMLPAGGALHFLERKES